MIRTVLITTMIAGLVSAAPLADGHVAARDGGQAPRVSATDAAPFVGDWTLALQGPNGPGTFELSIKVEKENVTGDISSEQLPKQPIREISMADKTMNLAYSFTWEGNPVEALVSLTPATDGKVTAQIDFAGGAYIMSGPATKKEKPASK